MITVVIPWRDKPTLSLVLEGLAGQTAADFEVFVINGGGHLDTMTETLHAAKLKCPVSFADLDPYVDDVADPARFLAGEARNLGAMLSGGERVLFLDADCVPAPDVVANHAGYSDENVVVAGRIDRIPGGSRLTLPALRDQAVRDPRYRLYGDSGKKLTRGFVRFPTDDERLFWSGHMSVPTKEFRECGGFWEELDTYGAEDQELAWRMRERGSLLRVDFTAIAWHIDHPPSLTGKAATRRRLEVMEMTKRLPLVRQGRYLP